MVRVLIERKVNPSMLEAYQLAIRNMRAHAVHHEGYISGETLRDVTDPDHFVVVSTWADRGAWERWAASEARHRVMANIAPMLEEPERITVCEPV
ncbi:MAG: antibiotic biosynthesis monooxygenase [Candidatus Dadabacteria bacterium]|nr:MAG: antibiotic biosynthesis monooxygenase [Candidatus Dadabacteria bacterium]